MPFQKATQEQAKLRFAIVGPSGSGKTFTSLAIATALVELEGQSVDESIAVVDTEHGSSRKYAKRFSFDINELSSFDPRRYVEAIEEAAAYHVLIIDSLSHAWMGKDGALELVDRAAKRSQSGNKFMAWGDVTPLHTAMIEALLRFPGHVIFTMRAKTEYIIETNDRGKSIPRKLGMAPIQREGVEYEADIVGEMTLDNEMIISKTRCPDLTGQVFQKPGKELAAILKTWLSDGVPPQERIDRDALFQQIDRSLKQIGWGAKDGQNHLRDHYGKTSRSLLNDQELKDFAEFLHSQSVEKFA